MKLLVIGKPINHSKSPEIHNEWLRNRNFNYKYEKKEVKEADLFNIITKIRNKEIKGINITLPYKSKIISHLDECDDIAAACNAVNTVYLKNNKIIGTNTDGIGFINSLEMDARYQLNNNSQIFIIGAGGAARGIIFSLLKRKHKKIIITNRNKDNAKKLIDDLNHKHLSLSFQDWKDKKIPENTDLIINTSSFGMKDKEKIILDYKNCKTKVLFFDIIYSPAKTYLLKDANFKGHEIQNGLGMLIRQAAQSFYKWFGERIEENEILEMQQRLKVGE